MFSDIGTTEKPYLYIWNSGNHMGVCACASNIFEALLHRFCSERFLECMRSLISNNINNMHQMGISAVGEGDGFSKNDANTQIGAKHKITFI